MLATRRSIQLTALIAILTIPASNVFAEDTEGAENDPHDPFDPAAHQNQQESSFDDLVRELALRIPAITSWMIR